MQESCQARLHRAWMPPWPPLYLLVKDPVFDREKEERVGEWIVMERKWKASIVSRKLGHLNADTRFTWKSAMRDARVDVQSWARWERRLLYISFRSPKNARKYTLHIHSLLSRFSTAYMWPGVLTGQMHWVVFTTWIVAPNSTEHCRYWTSSPPLFRWLDLDDQLWGLWLLMRCTLKDH